MFCGFAADLFSLPVDHPLTFINLILVSLGFLLICYLYKVLEHPQ